MKKLIARLKSLFKRKPKSTRVIVVNGRNVIIKNDDMDVNIEWFDPTKH